MTDNDLFALLISTLNEQLATWNFAIPPGTIVVQQKEQPVKQGIPTSQAIYLEKLFDHVYGSPAVSYSGSPTPNMVVQTEDQVYTSTFQVSALAIQKPGASQLLPTASDLASIARFILQRRVTIAKFKNLGVGILRVTDVRNPYFGDDRDRQEGMPSFDLVVTYVRTAAVTVDSIVGVESIIVQVP